MGKLIGLVVHFLLSGVAVFIVAKILPGMSVRSFSSAVGFAIALAILNAIAWRLLAPLTVPFAALTLGLGILIVNTVVFLLADKIVDGIRVSGWFSALIGSLVLTFVNYVVHAIFGR